MKNVILMKLLKNKKLTQQQFAELVQTSWSNVSGRKLSRQAVSAWVNGRETPRLSPAEMLIVTEILGCTLAEFALAFSENQNKIEKGVDNVRQTLHNRKRAGESNATPCS